MKSQRVLRLYPFGLPSLGALPELDGFGPDEAERERLRELLRKMAAARVE